MPADDWARDDSALGPRTVDALMVTLLAALGRRRRPAAVAWYRGAAEAGAALAVILAGLGVAAALSVVAMRKVRRDLHAPLARLYAWALGMCTGDFSTRVPADGEGAYPKLAFHINRLSEALEGLANEMDDVVWRPDRAGFGRRTRRSSFCTRWRRRSAGSTRSRRSCGPPHARSWTPPKPGARWSVCATQRAR